MIDPNDPNLNEFYKWFPSRYTSLIIHVIDKDTRRYSHKYKRLLHKDIYSDENGSEIEIRALIKNIFHYISEGYTVRVSFPDHSFDLKTCIGCGKVKKFPDSFRMKRCENCSLIPHESLKRFDSLLYYDFKVYTPADVICINNAVHHYLELILENMEISDFSWEQISYLFAFSLMYSLGEIPVDNAMKKWFAHHTGRTIDIGEEDDLDDYIFENFGKYFNVKEFSEKKHIFERSLTGEKQTQPIFTSMTKEMRREKALLELSSSFVDEEANIFANLTKLINWKYTGGITVNTNFMYYLTEHPFDNHFVVNKNHTIKLKLTPSPEEATKIDEIMEQIVGLKELKELLLVSDFISSIPDSILALKKLTHLTVIGEDCLHHIPEKIDGLSSLEFLKFHGGQLERIPNAIGNLILLKQLTWEYQYLKELPESLAKLKILYRLDLKGNFIATLPEWILELPSLKTIDLRDNEIDSTHEIVKKLQEKGVYIAI